MSAAPCAGLSGRMTGCADAKAEISISGEGLLHSLHLDINEGDVVDGRKAFDELAARAVFGRHKVADDGTGSLRLEEVPDRDRDAAPSKALLSRERINARREASATRGVATKRAVECQRRGSLCRPRGLVDSRQNRAHVLQDSVHSRCGSVVWAQDRFEWACLNFMAGRVVRGCSTLAPK